MSHHIWCNDFEQPEEGCKMCKELRGEYPEDRPEEEMAKKHFPNVIIRNDVNPDKTPH